jgi:hypothetical protein
MPSAGAETSPVIAKASRRAWLAASLALVLYLTLSIGYSLTRNPWDDEGQYADPAINLSQHGHLGNNLLAPMGAMDWPQVDRYTFWQLPMYPVVLGGWFCLVPPSPVSMRLLSVLFGCLYLFCWFSLVRKITLNETLALLITSVVALDYAFVSASSDGRVETICMALGYAGIAGYFHFRERNWTLAILLAASGGAGAALSHPLGGALNLSIATLVLMDWSKIRWRRAWVAAVPYLAGAAAYGAYISSAPQIFLAQFRGAAAVRVSGPGATIHNILDDAYQRYVNYYWTALSGSNRLKVVQLIFVVAGTVAVLLNRRLRSSPGVDRLLMLALTGLLGVAIIDNQKFPHYLVYSVPPLGACAAVWVYDAWQRKSFQWIAGGLMLASMLVTIGGFTLKIHQDPYRNQFMPAVNKLRELMAGGRTVDAPSQFGFVFGFGPPLVDDRYLGYFRGATLPDIAVVTHYYSMRRHFGGKWDKAEEWAAQMLETRYRMVLDNEEYKIYVRIN